MLSQLLTQLLAKLTDSKVQFESSRSIRDTPVLGSVTAFAVRGLHKSSEFDIDLSNAIRRYSNTDRNHHKTFSHQKHQCIEKVPGLLLRKGFYFASRADEYWLYLSIKGKEPLPPMSVHTTVALPSG
ncbi:hypothetical protein NQZ79_g5864 [Umbelopsis isabellina]|nr:hypothetical protein NQZ79_g5864 [Umbelopsis isabellina]